MFKTDCSLLPATKKKKKSCHVATLSEDHRTSQLVFYHVNYQNLYPGVLLAFKYFLLP